MFWDRIIKRPVSPRIGLALRLVLLTGVRVTEMAGAELSEFTHLDENQANLSIPPARSKNGRAHMIPLSCTARRIVKELVQIANKRAEELARRALELWSEHLQRIIKGVPTSDVILLRPASP